MATLGEQAVGSIVKLNVNGTAREFIVVHQGLPGSMYDTSCDGTWVIIKDIYTTSSFDSTNNDYANSDAHTYLNGTFLGLFDNSVQSAIKQVKIPYNTSSGANGLLTKVFLISCTELGFSATSQTPSEGAKLGYFTSSAMRIAYLNGTAANWWTRTPYKMNASASFRITTSGSSSFNNVTSKYGLRPVLVFPFELNVSDSGLVDGTIASAGAITGTVPINGVQRELTGAGYINIGGVLHDLSDSQSNIGGTLKSMKG